MNSGFRLTKVSPAIVLDKACLSQLWPRHVGQRGRAGCEGPGPPVPCAPLASRAPSIAPLKLQSDPPLMIPFSFVPSCSHTQRGRLVAGPLAQHGTDGLHPQQLRGALRLHPG